MEKSSHQDYFENHSVVVRWPFTLYHKPIEKSLTKTLLKVKKNLANRKIKILIFGCGMFHESHLFSPEMELTLVDADPRLSEPLKKKLGTHLNYRIVISDQVTELEKNLTGPYDLIIAKEVIEHITNAEEYLKLFYRVLNDRGHLWLSTPNYGDWSLPFIERTFLEMIARIKGFSRKHIHPNKYTDQKLQAELEHSGFKEIDIKKTNLALALTATATRQT